MKKLSFKSVISLVLALVLTLSVAYMPGMNLEASAACAGGCSFTAQKIGTKYLKSESTCGKQAEYYYSCDICGTSSEGTNEAKTFKYGTAPTHNWGPAVTVPATCTEPEIKVQTCTRCGEKYAKKGSGTGTGHSEKFVSNGDGTHTKICTKVGCTLHEVEECSTKEISCSYTPLCDYCNTSYNTTLGHDLVIDKITKQPTCTEKGEAIKKCSLCDYTITEVIDALGHDKKITNAIAPTCTYEGYHVYTCARCGIEDREKVAPLGHEYEYTPDGNATCTQDGTRTGKCIRCPKTVTDADPGSALGHSFTLYISNSNATCTDNATEWAACDRGCGVKDVREIPNSALGHDYIDNLCTRCHAVKDDDSSVCKHIYPDSWNVIITPDCQNKGAQVKVCTLCKNIISESLPKTGHIDHNGDSKCDSCDKKIVIVEPQKPEEKPCSCDCHAGGIKAFFFKLINFFAKIFDKNARVCDCGKAH